MAGDNEAMWIVIAIVVVAVVAFVIWDMVDGSASHSKACGKDGNHCGNNKPTYLNTMGMNTPPKVDWGNKTVDACKKTCADSPTPCGGWLTGVSADAPSTTVGQCRGWNAGPSNEIGYSCEKGVIGNPSPTQPNYNFWGCYDGLQGNLVHQPYCVYSSPQGNVGVTATCMADGSGKAPASTCLAFDLTHTHNTTAITNCNNAPGCAYCH